MPKAKRLNLPAVGGAMNQRSDREMIELDLIQEVSVFRARARLPEPQEVESLAKSIQDQGLIYPLVVRPSTSRPGTYELVAGYRRFRAMRSIGKLEAPAHVRDLDDEAGIRLAIHENEERRNMTDSDRLYLVGKWSENGLKSSHIAERLGMGERHVRHHLQVLKSDLARNAINAGIVPFTVALALAKATVLDGIDEQDLLTQVHEATVRQAAKWIRVASTAKELFEAVKKGDLLLDVAADAIDWWASLPSEARPTWLAVVRVLRGCSRDEAPKRLDSLLNRRPSKGASRRPVQGVKWKKPISNKGFSLSLTYRVGAEDELRQAEELLEEIDKARKFARARIRKLS